MTAVYQCAHEWGATIAVVAFFLFTIPGTRASAQTYLYNRAEFPTGNGPSAVVSADFNGDGKLDLAVVVRECGLNSSLTAGRLLFGEPMGRARRLEPGSRSCNGNPIDLSTGAATMLAR